VFRTHGLLRLAVALEDPDNLVADLAAALDLAVPAS
jgi:cystathionine beta-lyase/cystathionine gamma-synthase